MVTGCAGRDFAGKDITTFELGKTTYAQVVQEMGEPRSSSNTLKNGSEITTISYAFSTVGGAPLDQGVTPARGISFSFHNNMMVGKSFNSSFRVDNTDFDNSKVPSLVKGKTTREEVINIIGKPTAFAIPPMSKDAGGQIGYSYAATSGGAFTGFQIFRKSLVVEFDDQGITSEVTYTTSGVR